MVRQAIILAGGEGTRLRPLTYEIPKPLIPVQGLPILTWQLRWFFRYGVERALILIPAKWREAFSHWQKEQLVSIQVELWEEPESMGTMGGLVHGLHDRFQNEPVFVTNGDELKGLDLSELQRFHQNQRDQLQNYGVTIALIQVPNPSDYGVAELDGALIRAFHEKPASPPSNFVSSGLYVMEPRVLQEVPREKKFLMFEKDLFPLLAEQKRLGGCPLKGPWFDCGTFERWGKAIQEWKEPS